MILLAILNLMHVLGCEIQIKIGIGKKLSIFYFVMLTGLVALQKKTTTRRVAHEDLYC